MTPKQKIELRMSKNRERLGELLGIDDKDAEQRAELDTLTEGLQADEAELRAATMLEAADAQKAEGEAGKPEQRARVELRSACSLTKFVRAAVGGEALDGPERELAAELDLEPGRIPIEMFETRAAPETRAVTGAPDTVGVNLDPLLPAIFARSVCNRLGVHMPRVETGSYATGTITTNQTAAAKAKGAPAVATAGAFTVQTTTPHRVSARLELLIEDIAAVGADNFEAILRQNLMLAMSAELDRVCLVGDPTTEAAEPTGLVSRLADPANPSTVVDWAGFVSAVADGIDGGPWAESMTGVRLLVNAETMRLAETTFRGPLIPATDANSDTPGEMSAAAYLRQHSGGFFASSRMPATASTIAPAIRYRPGTNGLDGVNAMRTAVVPIWNEVGIDDPYTGSARGERAMTFHVLLGDVILTQPDAYERVDLKVSA